MAIHGKDRRSPHDQIQFANQDFIHFDYFFVEWRKKPHLSFWLADKSYPCKLREKNDLLSQIFDKIAVTHV